MIMIIIINEKDRWNLMAKYFFSSSFLLFLGNWIGQVGLNWFVLTTYHNAVYLGLVNFCRLIPILLLSVWAGSIADKYDKGLLLRITITSSFILQHYCVYLLIVLTVYRFSSFFYMQHLGAY